MLTITKTPEDLRLLEAAEIAEEQHIKGLYDQGTYGSGGCKSPACMLGGYAHCHKDSAAYTYITHMMTNEIIDAARKEFGVNYDEWDSIFGLCGCNNACENGIKA